eukprot:SM000061S19223  [mRNA]  locus=s61:183261:186065:+ [translate_table: standard]
MVRRLRQLYDQWNASPRALFVVLQVRAAPPRSRPPRPARRLTLEELRRPQAKGRAFCAGGDVRAIYDLGRAGDKEACREFFREEYLTNHKLATLSKPHVAVLDGVVMGGGNGISMHGTFRVATDKTLFAMPETAIALHPDVGASYFLSRLPGSLGEFLGLTGARLNGAELVDIGLATHYVPSHRLKMLDERWGDMRVGREEAVRFAIEEHAEIVELPRDSVLNRQGPEPAIATLRNLIDECFSAETVEGIIAALEERQKGGAEWCAEPLAALARMSPTSLKVTLRSIREGRRQDLQQCLEKEYRLTVRAIELTTSNDFYEASPQSTSLFKGFTNSGASELCLLRKTTNRRTVCVPSAQWSPKDLAGVSDEVVMTHFAPFENPDEELQLPPLEAKRQHARL